MYRKCRVAKETHIKTIDEVFDYVDEKNLDIFLQDFESYMRLSLKMQRENVIIEKSYFVWTDDEKAGLTGIRVVIENK